MNRSFSGKTEPSVSIETALDVRRDAPVAHPPFSSAIVDFRHSLWVNTSFLVVTECYYRLQTLDLKYLKVLSR